ncbi:hypothetical protein LXL04_002788 [Taraxacum kok-saghyz]
MCESLSVGVHTYRHVIRLVTILAAQAFGAPRIVIVEVDDSRLSVAKQLGANEIIKVSINLQVRLVGMDYHEMIVPLTPATVGEVDVVGIFRYKNTWSLYLEFLRRGKIDGKPLIS